MGYRHHPLSSPRVEPDRMSKGIVRDLEPKLHPVPKGGRRAQENRR